MRAQVPWSFEKYAEARSMTLHWSKAGQTQKGKPPPRTSAPRLHTNHVRAEAASFATTPEQLQPRQEVKGANKFLSAAVGPTCWQWRIWPPTQTAAKLLNFSQLRILGLQHQRYQNSIREYFSSAYNPNKFRPWHLFLHILGLTFASRQSL